MSIVITIIKIVVILGFLVLIHETGHFVHSFGQNKQKKPSIH